MKAESLLLILALAAAGYWGYESWQKDKIIAELKARPVEKPESNPQRPPPPPPAATVSCGKCGGTGKLIDNSGVREIGYICPLCLGAGKKQLPAGAAVCSRCQGIGRIEMANKSNGDVLRQTHRILAQLCPMCGGDGTFPDR